MYVDILEYIVSNGSHVVGLVPESDGVMNAL